MVSQHDGAAWRDEFPVTENLIYLDHASLGPIPRRVVQAMDRSLTAQSRRGSLEHPGLHDVAELARREYAAFIGARPEQIAHAFSTSSAISLIAAGLDWNAGDQVVVPAIDFPSAVLPWMTLHARGVVVNRVPCADGRVDIDALLRACGSRTRVVCVSWVQFSSGFRIDLERLGSACRERGILLVVDGIQGVGALKIDVGNLPIDALAVHAYKWLLAPQGVGWLYLADTLAGRLDISAAGPRSMTPRPSYFDHRFEIRADAARFETGILNFHGIAGARASMALLREAGAETIESQVLKCVEGITQGLLQAGCQIQGGADRSDFRSGIVAFRHPRHDAAACRAHLLEAGIVTAAREGHVRVAPHFYNSKNDVDAFVQAVRELG